MGAVVGAGEGPQFFLATQIREGAFRCIVREADPAVVEEAGEPVPAGVFRRAEPISTRAGGIAFDDRPARASRVGSLVLLDVDSLGGEAEARVRKAST
jgi:hypothetical protein